MNAATLSRKALEAPSASAIRPKLARWRAVGLVLLFWFGFFGLILPADIIEDMQMAGGANLGRDVFGNMFAALAWSVVSPLILWLTQRYPVEGERRWRNAGLQVAAGLSITVALVTVSHLAVQSLFGDRIGGHVHWTLHQIVLVNTAYLLFIYLAFVAIVHAMRLLRRSEERERLLNQAQVQALKAQLNPHFLYNTLNAVSEFAYKDAAIAERLITMLSDLLRLSFAGGDAPKVPLSDELAFSRRYLDIQQLLLEDRLQVRYAIDPAALDAQVPNFVLQPLVENAVVHGISRRAASGHIELGASIADGELKLWVSDDGPGMSKPSSRRHGIGLSHTRARLAQLYGERQQLELDSPPGGGFTASLTLPCER
ncbi:MAG: sensor histidine kinase [Nevskia sp.]|nr:sensor histidine kinase [Nevskia sp.]